MKKYCLKHWNCFIIEFRVSCFLLREMVRLNWLAIWAASAVSFCLWLFSVAYEASPTESRWSPSVVACQYLIDLHPVQWNYWFNLREAEQEEESFIACAITEEDSSICTASVFLGFFSCYWDNWPIGLGVVEGSEPYGRSCFYGYSHLLDALWKSWAAGPLSPPLSSLLPAPPSEDPVVLYKDERVLFWQAGDDSLKAEVQAD